MGTRTKGASPIERRDVLIPIEISDICHSKLNKNL